ncbi:MAG: SCO family protein [Flavobacteriia bacterium]|nr:SCO family protein [Flavobacteriia bacterium]OIP46006.1 MAG: SCO family protein [Flavobacteriaceae bacterium CG2_30_31_66]PIV95853.1 MAG: SCO family protein [Flavobacteriaceae bacterium CG17_big_fil_post_rev_8_21_14_2_50_31_13]PIY15338.1 MAG: SCO family protein [Flavobacteriaceae bacterium CG_4_10_14_3_um_filter_31_253]PIZ11105.1 MAG: SCO family protein [Flavobacteriaceae bacterium CG_4_10_14_0_8_um_filter_31_99]PJC09637.1 MAG: SCO family protein [Flavobacteriaceae bacterium CG_4_9_14_0_8_u
MELKFFKKSIPTLIFLAIFSTIAIPVFYHLLKVDKKLKIYSPADVNPSLVDVSVKHITKDHTIADFSLINQNGEIITQNNYKNKIYIADFFFTRCTNICIAMAYNMNELQEYYKNDAEIMFLSHSVTPEMDSVPILKKYAIDKGVIDGKWNVTTGDKKHIYELARKSYFAVIEDGDGGEDDFIHTEQFILVDKERRIRGFYDGTDKNDMEKLKQDVVLLKAEYED